MSGLIANEAWDTLAFIANFEAGLRSGGVYSLRKSELFPSTIRHLPNPSPTSKLLAPPNQEHRSVFLQFLWWFGILEPNARLDVREGVSECAPIRSGKILYFWNWNCAIWWILLGAHLEQAMSKNNSSMDLTDPNFAVWEKFWLKIC